MGVRKPIMGIIELLLGITKPAEGLIGPIREM